MQWEHEKIVNINSKLWDTFYYFMQLGFCQISIKKRILSAFWAIFVSFLLVQFTKDQLFIQLTTERFIWPRSSKELLAESDIEIISTNLAFMKRSGKPDVIKLADKTMDFPIESFVDKFERLSHGKTAFIARAIETDSFRILANPEKFVLLDEKYLMSHNVFYVSTKWPYHQKFVKM